MTGSAAVSLAVTAYDAVKALHIIAAIGAYGLPLAYPVLYQASTFGALLDERMVRYFRGRERMFDRLPYVLLQYTQGKNCLDIAHSVSYFSDGDDVEDAIDFAALLISNQLNRQR